MEIEDNEQLIVLGMMLYYMIRTNRRLADKRLRMYKNCLKLLEAMQRQNERRMTRVSFGSTFNCINYNKIFLKTELNPSSASTDSSC